jgi:hypothetical protein
MMIGQYLLGNQVNGKDRLPVGVKQGINEKEHKELSQ